MVLYIALGLAGAWGYPNHCQHNLLTQLTGAGPDAWQFDFTQALTLALTPNPKPPIATPDAWQCEFMCRPISAYTTYFLRTLSCS